MRTIFEGKSRWLTGVLTVLGGSVLLSACGSASPTSPEAAVTAYVATAEAGRASATQAAGFVICRWCYLIIDPVRVPGTKEITAFLNMANVGTEAVGNVHVTGYLLDAKAQRFWVAEVDQDGPRPRETVEFTVAFTVSPRVPAGSYRVAMDFDPENRTLPSQTWVSDEVVTVP